MDVRTINLKTPSLPDKEVRKLQTHVQSALSEICHDMHVREIGSAKPYYPLEEETTSGFIGSTGSADAHQVDLNSV